MTVALMLSSRQDYGELNQHEKPSEVALNSTLLQFSVLFFRRARKGSVCHAAADRSPHQTALRSEHCAAEKQKENGQGSSQAINRSAIRGLNTHRLYMSAYK